MTSLMIIWFLLCLWILQERIIILSSMLAFDQIHRPDIFLIAFFLLVNIGTMFAFFHFWAHRFIKNSFCCIFDLLCPFFQSTGMKVILVIQRESKHCSLYAFLAPGFCFQQSHLSCTSTSFCKFVFYVSIDIKPILTESQNGLEGTSRNVQSNPCSSRTIYHWLPRATE